jgi:patatin-like phospholipase/acyl hydrolase
MLRIKEIRRLEKIPKPCEYFHMIAGTSTGGYVTAQYLSLAPCWLT